MKLHEAVDAFDAIHVNTLDREIKQKWISDLDLMISQDIHSGYGCREPAFSGYGPDADQETELLVPAPYDEIYQHLLAMKWAQLLHEDQNYNREANMYNSYYDGYAAWYGRTHMHRPTHLRLV